MPVQHIRRLAGIGEGRNELFIGLGAEPLTHERQHSHYLTRARLDRAPAAASVHNANGQYGQMPNAPRRSLRIRRLKVWTEVRVQAADGIPLRTRKDARSALWMPRSEDFH